MQGATRRMLSDPAIQSVLEAHPMPLGFRRALETLDPSQSQQLQGIQVFCMRYWIMAKCFAASMAGHKVMIHTSSDVGDVSLTALRCYPSQLSRLASVVKRGQGLKMGPL